MDKRHMTVVGILIVFLCIFVPLPAQRHLSVPITDPVYHLLEVGQLRGLIDPLPSAKPYTRAMVDEALLQLNAHRQKLSSVEAAFLSDYVEEHFREKPWLEAGAIRSDAPMLSAEMGITIDGKYSITFAEKADDPYQGFDTFLNTYLDGRLGSPESGLSYRFAMDFGIHQYDNTAGGNIPRTTTQFAAFTPYTFTKPWDGYRYPAFDLFRYGGSSGTDIAYLGFRMTPEIAAEFYEGNLRLAFSRTPRNYGLGDDSIILSGQARPFLAAEVHAQIFEWMDYSVVIGTLENDGSSSAGGSLNQAMLTLKNVDMRPFPWLYLGIHEAVVWPKRFELGYINPVIFSSLYQGMGGDFDNLLGGITLGGSIPGYLEMFATVNSTEFRPESFSDLFERVRNFFSIQAGARAPVPGLSFSSLLLQYTKIEPFTFTHPPTPTPWLNPYNDQEAYQSFISDEYGIPSRLDPNSDELLIKLKFMPAPRTFLSTSYQLIRHGHYGGFYDRPLKSYGDSDGILPDDMADLLSDCVEDATSVGDLQKKFLADGPYEWYHIASITGEMNLSGILPLPLRLALTYSYTYQFMNNCKGERMTRDDIREKSLRPDFIPGSRNTVTVEFRVF